jgi:hypothetical protein
MLSIQTAQYQANVALLNDIFLHIALKLHTLLSEIENINLGLLL